MSKLEELTEAAGQKWMDYWESGPLYTRGLEYLSKLMIRRQISHFQIKIIKQLNGVVSERKTRSYYFFWRHFGCSCGVDRVARLKDEYLDYLDANVNIVIIGQGEPGRSRAYAKKMIYLLPPFFPTRPIKFIITMAYWTVRNLEFSLMHPKNI